MKNVAYAITSAYELYDFPVVPNPGAKRRATIMRSIGGNDFGEKMLLMLLLRHMNSMVFCS